MAKPEIYGCARCKHLKTLTTCTAFPDRIPLPIWSGEVPHLKVEEGQTGEDVFQLKEGLDPKLFKKGS